MTTAAQPNEVSESAALELRLYRQMVAIRQFEAQVNELYTRALMPGLAHLYIGEEAVAVGVCEALEQTDYITSTHRGHGHCLAKGASPDRMFAELLGKKAGYCKGKGGSMHIADPATGNLGANAIVCGSAGIATGAAFSARALGNGRVAVCFFGEGALGQGVLYEELNLAQLFKLPVIYVCENNLYTEYTHFSETTAGDILARATAFGLEAASARNWTQALEDLKQALELCGNCRFGADLHRNLGLVYLRTGDTPDGTRELEVALKLNPDDDDARKIVGIGEEFQALREHDVHDQHEQQDPHEEPRLGPACLHFLDGGSGLGGSDD